MSERGQVLLQQGFQKGLKVAAEAVSEKPSNVSRFMRGKEVQSFIPQGLDVSLVPVKLVNSRVTAKTWNQETVSFYWGLITQKKCDCDRNSNKNLKLN